MIDNHSQSLARLRAKMEWPLFHHGLRRKPDSNLYS